MSRLLDRRSFLLSAAAALAPLGGSALAASPLPLPGWFKYLPKQVENWGFETVDAGGTQVSVTPVGFDKDTLRKVVVIYSRASSAYDIAISKLLEVIDSKQIRLQFEIVNYRGNLDALSALVKQAEQDKVSAIVAMGSDPVADLWTMYRSGPIPVVTICAKDPVILGQTADYESGSGANFAFTSLNMPIDAQMGYLLRVRPHLKNLGILVDAGNLSAVETQAKPIVDYLNKRDIRAFQIAVTDGASASQQLPDLLAHSIEVMAKTDPRLQDSAFWITGSTSIFQQIGLINRNSRNIPVLSGVPEVVTEGDDSAAISIGVSFESNAHLAAVYLADILSGKSSPGALRVGVVTPPDIAINFRRVRASGLQVPFEIFDEAANVYDYEGRQVRSSGELVRGGRGG